MGSELGTLVVVVLKARNLPDKHSFYKQDVFAQVTLQGTTKKTQTDIKGGQHPVWDEELRFSVVDQGKKPIVMEVSCWSKESRTDDVVGKGELDISETLRTGEFDDWVPLSVNNVQRGDLYLEMTFYAASPPPALSRRPSKMLPADRLARPPQLSSPATTPSLPSKTAGHRPASTADTSRLRPQSAAAQRLSPRGKNAVLPSLPEEPASDEPNSGDLPAILRPGGGKVPSPQHGPRSSTGGSHDGSLPLPGSYSFSAPSHQSSLPPPSSLRPGGGASPVPHRSPPSQKSSYIPEAQIPVLPAGALGYVPGSIPTPQPQRVTSPTQEPVYNHAPHQPVHTSPHVYPAYDSRSRPAPSPTPTVHQRTHSSSQEYPAYNPRPPHVLSPVLPHYQPAVQSPTYEQRPIPALPPQPNPTPGLASPQVQWQAPPPSSYPHMQPSTYTADPGHAPAFAFPTPSITPVASPPTNGYYPPYSLGPTPRPYPYNYAPPPRDPDLDLPASLNNPRYSKPLPLPDEPEGVHTPTPAHPHGHVSPTPAQQNGHHKHRSQSGSQGKYQSAEERDRLVARTLELEEEERKRQAREQEERDLELARRLDLELNLDGVDAVREETALSSRTNGNAAEMPGAWSRH